MITGDQVDEFLEHFGVINNLSDDSQKIPEQILSQSDIRLENFLKHYGVRGQRWGVTTKSRSGGSSSGDSKGSSGKSSSGESKGPSGDTTGVAKSRTAHLSNDDLKKVVERMKLDQQYAELANPKKEGGKAYVSKMLKDSGSKLAGAAATAAAGILVAAAFSKYSSKAEAQKQYDIGKAKKALETAEAARVAFKLAPSTPIFKP